jgi:hypothetical protein
MTGTPDGPTQRMPSGRFPNSKRLTGTLPRECSQESYLRRILKMTTFLSTYLKYPRR